MENDLIFRPNWENSVDENDPFDSALSSIVSSPTASNNNNGNGNGENIVLRELIGKLSSICNSDQIQTRPRKRKSAPKGKGKHTAAAPAPNLSAKRSKSEQEKPDSKLPEPPKDYIHVRARRGQATDAHSLAERVRREKISERMKMLQDLVPGCNKVTGKAVMLDEIINYVESLQHQVEFLSMKLANVNPRMDFNNMEALMSKDMFQSHGSLYSSDGYPFPPSNGRNQGIRMENFGASQVSSFWEDDLYSVVHMGFGQSQMQNFQGILPKAQMKVEL